MLLRLLQRNQQRTETVSGIMDWLTLERFRHPPPVVAVVRLGGVIGQAGGLRRGLNLASLAGSLERAFSMPRVKAVALAINSPGGSPVQSSLIARRIRDLAEEKEVPVIAFVEDVAASGGYWLAVAADEIYADASSLVGSIGVVSAGFGLDQFIARHGIERRVYTAGEQKVILDPFQPEQANDVTILRGIQDEMHATFREFVCARRGGRLRGEDAELFEGRFWTGQTAHRLGLVDGIGHLRPLMRERFGDKVRLRLVGVEKGWLRRKLALSRAANVDAVVDSALAAVEERLVWSRYGL